MDSWILKDIYMMALLHDVGKIGIADSIINKKTKLTGARWHHERYDGKGYPDGIAGEDIPAEARIISVADTYDAMTSKRSYRDHMPQPVVRAELEKGMGSQLAPEFTRIMLTMIDEDVSYRLREW